MNKKDTLDVTLQIGGDREPRVDYSVIHEPEPTNNPFMGFSGIERVDVGFYYQQPTKLQKLKGWIMSLLHRKTK